MIGLMGSVARWVESAGAFRSRRPGVLAFGIVGITAVSLVWVFVRAERLHAYPWINHDNASYIHLGRMLLDGQTLYVDRRETNPPAVCFYGVAIAVISDGLGLPPVFVYHCFVVLLGMLGSFLLFKGVKDEPWAIGVPVWLAYSVVLARGNFIVGDFGQREHMFALLYLPYLFGRCFADSMPASRAFRVGYLVLLGFFAAMKPHFILLLIVVELVSRSTVPRARLEMWAALGSGMASSGLLLLLHSPASVAALFTEVIPFHLRGDYDAFDTPFGAFLGSPPSWLLAAALAVLVVAALCAIRSGGLTRKELAAALCIPAAAYLLFLAQHKFWSYHAAVLFAVCALIASYCWARWIGRIQRVWIETPLWLLLNGVLLWLLFSGVVGLDQLSEVPAPGLVLKAILPEHSRVMFLSTASWHSPVPLLLHLRTVGDWSHNYDFPHLVQANDRVGLRRYRDELARTIDAQSPDFVVFEPADQAIGRPIHDILVGQLGLFPRPGYRQLSAQELNQRCGVDWAYAWRVYQRID
jgi:hypothetical protein